MAACTTWHVPVWANGTPTAADTPGGGAKVATGKLTGAIGTEFVGATVPNDETGRDCETGAAESDDGALVVFILTGIDVAGTNAGPEIEVTAPDFPEAAPTAAKAGTEDVGAG